MIYFCEPEFIICSNFVFKTLKCYTLCNNPVQSENVLQCRLHARCEFVPDQCPWPRPYLTTLTAAGSKTTLAHFDLLPHHGHHVRVRFNIRPFTGLDHDKVVDRGINLKRVSKKLPTWDETKSHCWLHLSDFPHFPFTCVSLAPTLTKKWAQSSSLGRHAVLPGGRTDGLVHCMRAKATTSLILQFRDYSQVIRALSTRVQGKHFVGKLYKGLYGLVHCMRVIATTKRCSRHSGEK